MLAFRTVQQSNHCVREEFLYELKAGPAGRLRRPSSAGSQAGTAQPFSWRSLTFPGRLVSSTVLGLELEERWTL